MSSSRATILLYFGTTSTTLSPVIRRRLKPNFTMQYPMGWWTIASVFRILTTLRPNTLPSGRQVPRNGRTAAAWRGLGQSFGYNRADGEAQTIAPDKLIHLLVDIVSKNGNLLLDVGPEADGTIPAAQMERLKAGGAWLGQNGEAIYGTHPWKRAEGKTSDDVDVRFTRKDSIFYATLMGDVKGPAVTLMSLPIKPGARIQLLGSGKQLQWSQMGNDLKVMLPSSLPGKYAWVLKIDHGAGSL
jgi:hypothetical protein